MLSSNEKLMGAHYFRMIVGQSFMYTKKCYPFSGKQIVLKLDPSRMD